MDPRWIAKTAVRTRFGHVLFTLQRFEHRGCLRVFRADNVAVEANWSTSVGARAGLSGQEAAAMLVPCTSHVHGIGAAERTQRAFAALNIKVALADLPASLPALKILAADLVRLSLPSFVSAVLTPDVGTTSRRATRPCRALTSAPDFQVPAASIALENDLLRSTDKIAGAALSPAHPRSTGVQLLRARRGSTPSTTYRTTVENGRKHDLGMQETHHILAAKLTDVPKFAEARETYKPKGGFKQPEPVHKNLDPSISDCHNVNKNTGIGKHPTLMKLRAKFQESTSKEHILYYKHFPLWSLRHPPEVRSHDRCITVIDLAIDRKPKIWSV
ncbi:hypothetical protein DFH06DRAFT_1122676 [Mycena polygramma]|nr:hypothetical protein DFH06DRAFT_1122676 [Mycena polygramma]